MLILKEHLMVEREVPEAEFAAIDERCKAAAEEAVRFAEESPEPSPEALYEDVIREDAGRTDAGREDAVR